MTVRDYSATANDNTAISGIALSDTMLANALDNAIRQLMADSANFLLDVAKPTATTGSSNAYVLSTGGTVTAYADKVRLAIRPNFSNTGACTINVDAVGVVDLKVYTVSGIGDPAAGQIQSGGVYDIIYVDALSDFVVLNPSVGTMGGQDASSVAITGGTASGLAITTSPITSSPINMTDKQLTLSKGADVASAAELLVLTDGNDFDVTGTTDITSIEHTLDAIPIGTTIQLTFDGVLTLTHHATDLILFTGANITTEAGDVGRFTKYASGDWIMVGFQRASGQALVRDTRRVKAYERDMAGEGSSSDFTGLGDYEDLEIEFNDVDTSSALIYLRTSTDDGSSFDATGYISRAFDDNSGVSDTTGLRLADGVQTIWIGGVDLRHFNDANARTTIRGIIRAQKITGFRDVKEANNAVQIFTSAGTFISGKVIIWGRPS